MEAVAGDGRDEEHIAREDGGELVADLVGARQIGFGHGHNLRPLGKC
jgi:hypothetical protein